MIKMKMKRDSFWYLVSSALVTIEVKYACNTALYQNKNSSSFYFDMMLILRMNWRTNPSTFCLSILFSFSYFLFCNSNLSSLFILVVFWEPMTYFFNVRPKNFIVIVIFEAGEPVFMYYCSRCRWYSNFGGVFFLWFMIFWWQVIRFTRELKNNFLLMHK